MVLRKRVTTRHLRATRIRSCTAHQLGDRGGHLRGEAGRELVSAASSAAGPSSQLRKSPTVRPLIGAKAAASCSSRISRVTSSCS